MGHWNREPLEKIKKLCLDRDAEDSRAFCPCQDILGLVFLRFVCAAAEFNSKAAPAAPGQDGAGGGDPENERQDTRDRGIFVVPDSAAWDRIFPGGEDPVTAAKGAERNVIPVIARAVRAIERENPALKDIFPRILTRAAGRRSSESPGRDVSFLPELGRLLGGLSAPEAGRVFTELMAEFEGRAAPLLARGSRTSPRA
ncbi:MAG: hypothetical protein LBF63_09630, partial [Treponema sp.]|nr:hypothetical protein [Treponema sp.]